MIEYRRIRPNDVPSVTAFALEVLRRECGDAALHIAPLKVQHAVRFFAADTSGRHFNLAAFRDGEPVGAMALLTAEMTYFEREEAHVVMAFASVPLTIRRLVADAMAWFRSEPRLRRILWPQNTAGARFVEFTGRFGFASTPMLTTLKE